MLKMRSVGLLFFIPISLQALETDAEEELSTILQTAGVNKATGKSQPDEDLRPTSPSLEQQIELKVVYRSPCPSHQRLLRETLLRCTLTPPPKPDSE